MAAMQAGTFAAATFASSPVARRQVAATSSLGVSEVRGEMVPFLTQSDRLLNIARCSLLVQVT